MQIIVSDYVLHKSAGPNDKNEFNIPADIHTAQELGYFIAKDKSVPSIVLCSCKPGRTADHIRTLKKWLLLGKKQEQGTVIFIRKQPMAEWTLAELEKCFKDTRYKVKVLATSPTFHVPGHAFLDSASKYLPGTPNNLSSEAASVLLDTLARRVAAYG